MASTGSSVSTSSPRATTGTSTPASTPSRTVVTEHTIDTHSRVARPSSRRPAASEGDDDGDPGQHRAGSDEREGDERHEGQEGQEAEEEGRHLPGLPARGSPVDLFRQGHAPRLPRPSLAGLD